MKTILIQIAIDEISGKIATAIKTNGFCDSVSKELELLGIYQNLAITQQEKLKTLARKTE